MKFHDLYLINGSWDFDSLLIFVGGPNRYKMLPSDKFELITAVDADEKYGNQCVYSFSNNIVRLVKES